MTITKLSLKALYTIVLQTNLYAIKKPLKVAKLRPEFYDNLKTQKELLKSLTDLLFMIWDSLTKEEKDYYIGITSAYLEAAYPHFLGLKGFSLYTKLFTISLSKNTNFPECFIDMSLMIARNLDLLIQQDKSNIKLN